MGHPFKFAIACIVACLVIVLSLYVFADKPNTNNNGFSRLLPSRSVKLIKSVQLKYPAYYIAGFDELEIYLGNYSASLHLLRISMKMSDTSEFTIRMPPGEKYAWKLSRLMVDSNKVFLTEGTTPALYRGDLKNLTMSRFLPQSCFFNMLQLLSSQSFIARGIQVDSLGNKNNVLAKIQTDSPFVKIERNILKRQVDGIFCTDGTMDYDRKTGKMLYLYHYRNEFIVLDSNLRHLYSGHTLDTNSIAKIKVADMSTGVSKFSAPPTYVNKRVRIHDEKIYILSSLSADNESKSAIEKNDIIDVYSLNEGNYLSTIYIPVEDNDRILDFFINDDRLFALKDKSLSEYSVAVK